ncbi:Vps41 protein [Maudiozyma humilis]|uniref:Vacuolar protein sorting-associated protein 41 n=1 Tax=Maudiozyma humilis TaxID=51915 RepID=A0AAV5RV36_MAUHU|nr:Vps41 protein [Kazachstania humilis]
MDEDRASNASEVTNTTTGNEGSGDVVPPVTADQDSNDGQDGSQRDDGSSNKEEDRQPSSIPAETTEQNDVSSSTSNGGSGTDSENDDSSGSEDDDTSGSDEEDEDEEPPLLTYSRIKNIPIRLFQRDTISACNFHDSIFIFGTHSGMLYFTTPHFELIDTLKCHRSSILSIYTDGVSFATASIDGTIVTGLVEDIKSESLIAYDFKRPVNSVVLDTDYLTNRTFVSGGMAGELILSQRNWLGNKTDIVLAKGEGPILSIQKREDILFWFTSTGIHFYDIHSRTSLLNVELPKNDDNSNPFQIFKPHVYIPERDRIFIGWMDHIWTFKISLATKNGHDGFTHGNIGSMLSSAASSFKAMPEKDVDLEYHFVVPLLIAGIASFKDDQLLCLGYEKEYDSENELILKRMPPQLKIFNLIDGSEIYNDEIVCKDYEKLSINDYHLGKHIHPDGELPVEYYLICTSDAIKIKELTLKDHYDWFLKKNQFYEAWSISQYVVDDIDQLETGFKYIDNLLEEGEWGEIGSFMSKVATELSINTKALPTGTVLPDTIQLFNKEWEKLIDISMKEGKLSQLVDSIPYSLHFEHLSYDSILLHVLEQKDTTTFSKLIQCWPLSIFSATKIENKLQQLFETHDTLETFYVNQLIYLLLKDEKQSKALPYMIDVKDPKTIRILQNEPELFSQVMDKLMDIILIPTYISPKLRNAVINNMTLSEIEQALWEPIALIVANRNSISIDKVIATFQEYAKTHSNIDKLLLCILLKIDIIQPDLLVKYENDMINLLSRFDKGPLLEFLQSKTHYDVEKAIQICSSQNDLYYELIYLWGRIGETKKALSIIVNKLNDPSLAIDYIKSWGDVDLWDFLIEYTVDKPNFVDKLLNSYSYLGDKYANVVAGLNDNLRVEEVSSSIIHTLQETDRSYQVNENILKIVDKDTSNYAKRLLELRTRGTIRNPAVESA